MAKKIRKLPFALRLAYAWDAVPEAAKANLNGNSLMMAINAIEAQRENVDPRKIGLDIDKDSTVEEIVARFCPECDEASKTSIVELLGKLKGAPDTVVVEETVKEDEEPEMIDEEKLEVKDEGGEEQKAFAEGVEYGEKKEKEEPVHLDRLHESEGMKRYEEEKDKPATDEDKDAKIQEILSSFPELDEEQKKKLSDALNDLAYSAATGEDEEPEEEQKAFAEGVDYGEKKEKEGLAKDSKPRRRMAMDAASIKRRVREEMMADFKARSRAASQVRGVLGNIDVMAFDSAEAIYEEALRKVGINTRQYAPSSYAAMFAAYNTNRSNGRPVAQDAKPIEFSGAFANLKNIKISD